MVTEACANLQDAEAAIDLGEIAESVHEVRSLHTAQHGYRRFVQPQGDETRIADDSCNLDLDGKSVSMYSV